MHYMFYNIDCSSIKFVTLVLFVPPSFVLFRWKATPFKSKFCMDNIGKSCHIAISISIRTKVSKNTNSRSTVNHLFKKAYFFRENLFEIWNVKMKKEIQCKD